MTCLEKIEKAQKGLEGTDAFAVGEQLKELCEDPVCGELVARDLETKGMNLTDCAAKVKAYADAHRRKGTNFSYVPPKVAEGIIREFYGLPASENRPAAPTKPAAQSDFLNLEDLL